MRLKFWLPWAVLAAAIGVSVGVAICAYLLAQVSWNGVVDYRSQYAKADLPQSGRSSAVASQTVLVIVDGLRLDASRRMGTLNAMRDFGADLTLTAPQPSLSYPNWTTLLSGAPPYISGVVTNWHEGPAPVETIFDTARASGVKTVFVGPEDFEQLYGVKAKTAATYMRKWDERYMTAEYVDATLRLAKAESPDLIVLHLPDADEAGHAYGGASLQYSDTVARMNADLKRLVEGLQSPGTVFVVVADHGHLDTGGHGGWEREVTQVPGVFAGGQIPMVTGTATSQDVAPTLAALAGIPVPRFAVGQALTEVVGPGAAVSRSADQRVEAVDAYADEILGPTGMAVAPLRASSATRVNTDAYLRRAQEARLAFDRRARAPYGLAAVVGALLVIAAVGVMSWRALVAAAAGAASYYVVYNTLFFGVHRYLWSLSAFNSEDRISAWMNGRLLEAALSAVVAVAVAAVVYPLLRQSPKPPRGEYLPGWLALGPATILVVLATLALQVAWFAWWWGVVPTWTLPDLKWGFKYDLDLVQATAVGFVALVAPLVTYLIGRYHPKVRMTNAEE